jgi:hypothetical protein
VVEVFAFQVHAAAAAHAFGKILREIKRRRPAHVIAKQLAEFLPEYGIAAQGFVRVRQFLESGEQGFRHVAAAVGPEMAAGAGLL